jgi:hypothetical protein
MAIKRMRVMSATAEVGLWSMSLSVLPLINKVKGKVVPVLQ